MYLDTLEYLNETVLFVRVLLQLPVMRLRTNTAYCHVVRYYVVITRIALSMDYYCLLLVRARIQTRHDFRAELSRNVRLSEKKY